MILQFWLALWPSEAQVHGSKYFVLYTDWKSHIEYIYHKLIRLVGIFYKVRNTGPTNLHKLLPAGCHGNLTVLNILSASVTKKSAFSPCRKNYALDRKMIGTTCSISMQGLGEIELRAPAGAKIGVFCMSRLVCLRIGDIVQTSIV